MSREACRIPFLMSNVLTPPKIQFRVDQANGLLIYDFDSRDWDWATHEVFYAACWKELAGSEDINVQISYTRSLTGSTRRLLKDTILVDDRMIAYCYLGSCRGGWADSGMDIGPSGIAWHAVLSASAVLVSHLHVKVPF